MQSKDMYIAVTAIINAHFTPDLTQEVLRKVKESVETALCESIPGSIEIHLLVTKK